MRKNRPQPGEIWAVHSLTAVYSPEPPHYNIVDKSKEIWDRYMNGEPSVTVMIIRREGPEEFECAFLVLLEDAAYLIKESNLLKRIH